MYDANLNTKDDGGESRFQPAFIQQPMPSVISPALAYHNNPPYNQAVNFGPSILNQYPPPLSPCFLNNSPLTPAYLNAPGLPQYASSPGFLTGAGFQFSPGSPQLGGLCLHGSFFSLGQAGMPLHAAAIVGDKQKILELIQDESLNLENRDRWGRVALVYAVLGNHNEIVEILLSAGAKPDATDAQKCTPLHFAAYKGNLGSIKSLLHAVETKSATFGEGQGRVWLAQDVRGVTPLHHAAHHSNHKCLQALLKYASPGTLDTVDQKKRTPLHWAAAYGSDENVRLLIKHGANNLMPDQEGKTPLHWAALSKASGAKGCVRTLISAAPSSVNWQDFDGITALHLAVAETRLDAVDVILSVPKCNVDLTDNQFRTALHWACSRGITTIVGRLLDRGAHLGAVDLYGATPLHYAAQLNHADTVELLVRRPCVRDDPSKEGHTALLWAAARGADLAITAMVRHGASLTKADPRGCTPLHIAAGAGHVSTVGVLLRLRAPADVCANDGRTPLLHAAQAGHAHIVKLLVKAGASLDHRDNEGQCALHHAVLSGHLYLAQVLIKAGTSVNVQDYSGRTPLHMAAYRGLTDIMFLLLENRGDVNARDHEGQTPLHWAAQQGHLGAVNTLLDFHAYPNYTQTTVNRYTPLDCADVAEQLEIAQVLMEAGGLSVTKIRDIAASRIQAVIRGYLTRKNYVKLKSFPRNAESSSDVPPDHSNGTIKTASQFVTAVIKETSVHCQASDTSRISESEPNGGVPYDVAGRAGRRREKLSSDKNLPISQEFEDGMDEVLRVVKDPAKHENVKSTRALCGKLSPSHRLSPDKNSHHRRRSKALASNIKLGARKKTFRDLELPDPGELGIEVQTSDILETSLQSDDDDNPTGVPQAAQRPRLAVGKALGYPRNIASALITVHVQGSTQGNKAGFEDGFTDEDQKGVSDKDVQKCNSDSERETTKCCDIWHSENALEPCTCKGNQEVHDKIARRKLLEEKFAKALEVAHKEANASSNSNIKSHNRQILSASARKQAEDKWNNKLATLTLQVQRPNSAKSAMAFSYNLVPPTNSKRPSSKKAQVALSDE